MAASVTGSRFPNPEKHTQAENPAPKVLFLHPKIFHLSIRLTLPSFGALLSILPQRIAQL